MTTDQAIDMTKAIISGYNIEDEDLCQDMYLAAISFAKDNKRVSTLTDHLRQLYHDSIKEEESEELDELDPSLFEKCNVCYISENVLLKVIIDDMVNKAFRVYSINFDDDYHINRNFDIFKCLYGICGKPKMTQHEIAIAFDLSEARVHRITQNILRLMRRVSTSYVLKDIL